MSVFHTEKKSKGNSIKISNKSLENNLKNRRYRIKNDNFVYILWNS